MSLEASRILFRSSLLLLLFFVTAEGGQLEDTEAARWFPLVEKDAVNEFLSHPQMDFIPISSTWMNEEKETNGQRIRQNKASLFYCEETGVFPVTGSCKEFFYCETMKGADQRPYAFQFTCPVTTVFDDVTKTCITSSLSSRPECRNAEHLLGSEANKNRGSGDNNNLRRRKRSDEIPTTKCTNSITEYLAQSSRVACSSSRDIDTYITNVKTVQPLELRSLDKEEFKAIIRDYNNDLSLAQRHYDEWRHGDSVFSVIKETFLTAKNFELTFNKKFEENQIRVKEITSEGTPDIKKMEEDIASLKAEIKEAQEVISTLEGLQSDQEPLNFLKDRLTVKEKELEQLVSNDLRVKTEREVAALIDFLELVRLTVVEIQQKAIKASSRVETFQQKIVTDSSIFLRHSETAEIGIKDIQNQKKNNEAEKVRTLAEQRNLQNRVQQDYGAISHIRNLISNTENEIRNIDHRISRMEREARDRQIAGGILFIIPVAGWIAGGVLLGTGIEDEKRLRNQRRDSINYYRSMIDTHYSQINSKMREIQYAGDRISTLTAASRRLDEELASFSELDQDLADIQTNINTILPSVNNALLSIAKMKTAFDDIKEDLDSTLEIAKSSKEQAEEKNLVYFIYNNISNLKCKWNQANAKIVALDQCI